MSAHRFIGRLAGGLAAIAIAATLAAGPVQAQNAAPTISGTPPTLAVAGQAYLFQPTASDPNGDRLTFNATGVPNWARFDKRTGQLAGTPTSRQIKSTSLVAISVTDGKASASLPTFTITVTASLPPSISGAPKGEVTEGELYTFQPTASDPDSSSLRFSIAGKPSWASFSSTTGLLSGIPPVGSAGTYPGIAISVTDGATTVSLAPFSLTVKSKGNSAPAIWGVPATGVTSGQPYSFQPSASDPDGQPLSFQIQAMPSWGQFDTTTGKLSGTPVWSDAGKYSSIVISVNDGIASTSLAPFSITVTAPNTPPSISGAPADSVTAGQAYQFVPTASDPEGQALTFSITNKPDWAAFDPASGRLSGTPTNAEAATYSNIVIAASDGVYSAQLPAFSITVIAQVQGSATLSWVPPTTNVDGTPIKDLAGYRIVYGQAATSLSQSLDIGNAVITTAVIEGLAKGTWYFAVKAYTAAKVESDLSTVKSKTIY